MTAAPAADASEAVAAGAEGDRVEVVEEVAVKGDGEALVGGERQSAP